MKPDPASSEGSEILSLPLVSIVITNYNYGHFLRSAFASAQNQTYPAIEIIIVDDASTDESGSILDRIRALNENVIIIRNDVNRGQTYGFYAGYLASAGQYVIFLDADDVLFPRFVEINIFVHLSSRVHAGFTTCDMVECASNQVVTGAHFPPETKSQQIGILRRIDAYLPELWTFSSPVLADIDQRVRFISPAAAREKLFAPTSGNCFRCDALQFFLDEQSPMALRLNTDVYLREGIFLFTGAILIDLPLFAYRLHGQNGFSKAPNLYGRRSVDLAKDRTSRQIANRALVDRLIDRAELFTSNFGHAAFTRAFDSLAVDVMLNCGADTQDFVAYTKQKMQHNRVELTKLLGEAQFEYLLNNFDAPIKRDKRRWRKLIAELLLTLGRAFNSRGLMRMGDSLWHL